MTSPFFVILSEAPQDAVDDEDVEHFDENTT